MSKRTKPASSKRTPINVDTPRDALLILKIMVDSFGGKLLEVKVQGTPFGVASLGTSDTKYLFLEDVCVKVVKNATPAL